jgi:hypothetical protein
MEGITKLKHIDLHCHKIRFRYCNSSSLDREVYMSKEFHYPEAGITKPIPLPDRISQTVTVAFA